ncbi:MAG: hypothetical protein AAF911_10955 [Planctomycetota bacterium]
MSWNPRKLEQRTSRVDRIGARGERYRQPIYVCLPYIAETQNEKMFRVVPNRKREFNVTMGEEYSLYTAMTERLADRIPLPHTLAEDLKFDLCVATPPR